MTRYLIEEAKRRGDGILLVLRGGIEAVYVPDTVLRKVRSTGTWKRRLKPSKGENGNG